MTNVVSWISVAMGCIAFAACGPVGCSGDAAGAGPTTAKSDGPTSRPSSFAVVELFTSEGCSSCPPADDLIAEVSAAHHHAGRRVLALEFHVDYWDRLGWRDPYSDPSYSDRQRAYAAAFKSESVYTPQAVVNGTVEFVGSNRDKLTAAIDQGLSQAPTAAVTLKVAEKKAADRLTIQYEITQPPRDAVLNIALVEGLLTTRVARGENGGRVLHHGNVVRAFSTVRPEPDGTGKVELTVPNGVVTENVRVLGYLQSTDTKSVLAAVEADLPSNANRPIAPAR